MTGVLDKLEAITRREVLSALRYRAGFALELLGVLAEVAAFFFLARAIGPGFRPDGVEYFPFLLVGTSFYTFLLMGVSIFVDTVRQAQMAGTMEVLMATSTPGLTVLLLDAVAAFIGRTFHLVFALAAGILLFRVPLVHANFAAFLVVFALSLAVAVGLGMIAAAIQVQTQKAGAALWLFGSVTALLTGMMFPVSALPPVLQKLSWLVPITHSLNGLRSSLLRGASFTDLAEPIAVLAGYAMVLIPLSFALFARVLRSARRNGTLSLY